MIFNNKLPTDLYTTFQIIKLLIEKGNLNLVHNKNSFPTDLYTTFQIIKLVIEKGNLSLVHNKISYQHFNYLPRKRKLDKLYNEM